MKTESNRKRIKRDIARLIKSMDFLSQKLQNSKGLSSQQQRVYCDLYQQLGMAWEFLGLQCRHWEGYRRARGKKETCKICGKVKGADEHYYLFPRKGAKKVGRKLRPNSKKAFSNKQDAIVLDDAIDFHGSLLKIDVHNAYQSKLSEGRHKINIAAERTVRLKERGIECYIDEHLVHLKKNGKKASKYQFAEFPWEIRKKDLKNFPVLFEFDEKHRFLGLTIFWF